MDRFPVIPLGGQLHLVITRIQCRFHHHGGTAEIIRHILLKFIRSGFAVYQDTQGIDITCFYGERTELQKQLVVLPERLQQRTRPVIKRNGCLGGFIPDLFDYFDGVFAEGRRNKTYILLFISTAEAAARGLKAHLLPVVKQPEFDIPTQLLRIYYLKNHPGIVIRVDNFYA